MSGFPDFPAEGFAFFLFDGAFGVPARGVAAFELMPAPALSGLESFLAASPIVVDSAVPFGPNGLLLATGAGSGGGLFDVRRWIV